MDNLSEYDVIELEQDNLGGIRSKIRCDCRLSFTYVLVEHKKPYNWKG